ncbi:ATP synthase F1 subunit gamma [Velocimicrobium porci]|uniref:ATP synthase gamma chain n=1 Tax=Velocimicrobium porci TaxID=2606634 RepID=A0A6L5XW92_9FIRM|nr:ATP synthase F1 subunit gamma [Velocimicrobium porci]MSS62879.1 ATP synthase F1 subunit gamma [Velocimicrobium porci]
MASMRDIKRRKGSIQSTGQITKAMKLVSTVKLQKAKTNAEESKPYFEHLYDAINTMLKKSGNISHPMLSGGTSKKKAIIVVTSNRGLAGGYNANVVKLLTKGDIPKEDIIVYAVGRKGKDTLARLGYDIRADYSEVMNAPLYSDAAEIGRAVLDAFSNDEVGEIYIAYTIFKNTVVHIPTLTKLLPFTPAEEKDGETSAEQLTLMNYEPAAEEVLEQIIPKYINGQIFGALVEAFASENGARMQAMDNATNNAEDMIADLSLKYNRARQSSITQELTEIVAGASAIN